MRTISTLMVEQIVASPGATFTASLAALWLSLTHFVLPKDSAAWAEVCTATGAKFVQVDT